MCGIVGVLKPPGNFVSCRLLHQMRDIMYHRGPDDEGSVFLNTQNGNGVLNPDNDVFQSNLALGFRRLAIIDLSKNASQPMTNQDKSLWLTFNGEIYNYAELRKNLSNKSRVFKSNSDTEVILALYEEQGIKAFEKLNGMFAFSLWDQRLQRLFLVRDRMGIKPLYYSTVNGSLVFGSEIKSLLFYPGLKRGLDSCGVIDHFAFQYCLKDRTMFKGIKLIEPGSCMEFVPGATVVIKRKIKFWEMKYSINNNKSQKVFAGEVREALEGAIKRQTHSDVSVGAFLSGGMDSGSVCAVSKKVIDNLDSFTCGFNVDDIKGLESYFDESNDARELARLLKLNHHEWKLNCTHMSQLLPKVMWHLEEPRVGICYQVYDITQKIREYVTVVLSGMGGDELFGGYHWRYKQILGMTNKKLFDDKYYQIWSRLLNDKTRKNYFSKKILRNVGNYNPRISYNEIMKKCDESEPLHRAMFFDFQGFLQGLLLVEDKLSMANSVETRVPLLDNEFIDLVLTIPANMKYEGGITKLVLKEALKGLLPEEVLHRRKQGFTPPDAHWFRHYSMPYIKSILLSEQFLDRGWFEKKAISEMLEQHKLGSHNHRFLIWSLLCFEWMHRLFLDPSVPTFIT
jgi:asparagine synthase (glutamine-hydrolysing)